MSLKEKIQSKIQSHYQNSFLVYQRSDGFKDTHNKTPDEIEQLLKLSGEPMPYPKVFDLYSETIHAYIPLSEWCKEWGIRPTFQSGDVFVRGQRIAIF